MRAILCWGRRHRANPASAADTGDSQDMYAHCVSARVKAASGNE